MMLIFAKHFSPQKKMGNTNNNVNDAGLNAIQTQTLEDFANSLCCSACKSSKSTNDTVIEVCVCVYICSRLHVFQLSLQLSFSPRNCFFLSVCFSHLSLTLSLSMNTLMDERFENLFSKVSIGDDAKKWLPGRASVFLEDVDLHGQIVSSIPSGQARAG